MKTLTAGQIKNALKKATNKWKLEFNDAKIILALERLIARLEMEPQLKDRLVLKGGFILLKCFDHPRFTRDLDAVILDLKKEKVGPLIKSAIATPLDDGFWFGDIRQETLVPDDPYGAFRFSIAFQLGVAPKSPLELKKLSRIHLDIGFGDVITPAPEKIEITPIIEEMESISSIVYPLETIIAEKLETLIKRSSLNSRAKDIFDLVRLLPRAENKKLLKDAIEATFKNRETTIPESFYDYVDAFDLLFLKNAWKSVELMDSEINF